MNDFIYLSFFVQFLWINFGEWFCRRGNCRRQAWMGPLLRHLQRAYADFTYAKYSYFIDFLSGWVGWERPERTQ